MNKQKFKKIDISGYRRLSSINELEMRPLMVMIGANGAGKTSLLEIFSLLAASAKGELKGAMSDLGGFQAVVSCGVAESVSFGLSMEVPGHEPVEYNITLSLQGISYSINHEVLSQRRKGHYNKPFKHIDSDGSAVRYWNPDEKNLVPPNWEYYFSETALSQVPKMYQEPESLRNQISSCTYYSAYALNVGRRSPIRLPQEIEPATHPGSNGEKLVSCLFNLRESDRDRFAVIQDTLAVAFPGFIRLNFPPVAAGTVTMTWEDENLSKPVYMTQLSEGTLRFLWLITLLYSPALSAITLIDEPEVSLHPQLLNVLRDAMREASHHTQLIVATHSDRLISYLDPAEVLVLDTENGFTQMTWADSEEFDLDTWLQDYSLDELWRMGHIGGKP